MNYQHFVLLLSLTSTLVACGGSSSGDSGSGPVEEIPAVTQFSVDSTSNEDFVYFRLDDLSEPVTISEPSTSTDWDIGFRRTGIILNGGASGSGEVAGALAVAQDTFYDADGNPDANAFLNALPENEGQVAFSQAIDTATLTFVEDSNESAIAGYNTPAAMGWYNYDMTTHIVSANSDAHWIVRSAAGDSFAIINVTDLSSVGRVMDSITLGFDIQAVGASAFSGSVIEKTFTGLSQGAVCYDFDADSTGDCSDSDWDLRIDPSFEIWLNSGVYGKQNGGSFGALDDMSAYSSGAQVPHWSVDSTSGVFSQNLWYAYDLQGQHKLWPNYRVYVIKAADSFYKFQVQSYYDESGTSAVLTVNQDAL